MNWIGLLILSPILILTAFAIRFAILDQFKYRRQRKAVHKSDCAIYNEPAMPAGPCDCGAND